VLKVASGSQNVPRGMNPWTAYRERGDKGGFATWTVDFRGMDVPAVDLRICLQSNIIDLQ